MCKIKSHWMFSVVFFMFYIRVICDCVCVLKYAIYLIWPRRFSFGPDSSHLAHVFLIWLIPWPEQKMSQREPWVRKCKIFVIQGQVTPKLVVLSGPNSNSSELLCLSWLPATLMIIRSKMNELHVAWRQQFPIVSTCSCPWASKKFPKSVVRSGQHSNSSEILCMSSLPASIKRISSKTTEKGWRHRFPHYKSMGAFCCHGNPSFDPICLKT